MSTLSPQRRRELDLPLVPRKAVLEGHRRKQLAAQIATAYEEKEASIREISAATGRSYGAVRDLLAESGIQLRARGGTLEQRRRIETTVRGRIADRSYPPGGLLPPLAALAEEFGVTVTTTRTALAPLKREGLLTTSRPRCGTRVAADGGGNR